MKRQIRSHRIVGQARPNLAPKLTDEQRDQIDIWIGKGYTDIEAARAGFRAWARDISPSTIRRQRNKGDK